MLERIGVRLAKSTLEKLENDPEFINRAQSLVGKVFAASPQRANPGSDNHRSTETSSREAQEDTGEAEYPQSEGAETYDPVEETLLEAMEDAREHKRFSVAVDVAKQLKRHRAGRMGGRPESRSLTGKDSSESLPVKDLDIANLAPHANEIADEVLKWVGTLGVDLNQKVAGIDVGAIARSELVKRIRDNPSIVKDGLDMFNGLVNRFAAKAGLKVPGAQAQLQYDPSNPATFPEGWFATA